VRYLNIDRLLQDDKRDAHLAAKILAEIARTLRDKLHSDRFYVEIVDRFEPGQRELVIAELKALGVRYFDYSQEIPWAGPPAGLWGDPHPAPATIARIAERLATDVGAR
jgi:hypothetical protein